MPPSCEAIATSAAASPLNSDTTSASGESMKDAGKDMPDTRISRKMTHVGFYVSKPETAKFYIDVLGFREFWRGSADGKTVSYSNLYAPEGDEYVECLGPPPATLDRMGTVYHIALEVPDMD